MALNAGAGSLIVLPIAWLLARERTTGLNEAGDQVQELLSRRGFGAWAWSRYPSTTYDMLHTKLTLRAAAYELSMRTVTQHFSVAWSRLRSDPRKDVSVIAEDGKQMEFAQ